MITRLISVAFQKTRASSKYLLQDWQGGNRSEIPTTNFHTSKLARGAIQCFSHLGILETTSQHIRFSSYFPQLPIEVGPRHRCFFVFLSFVFFCKLREWYTEDATSASYFCLFLLFCYCLPGPANLPRSCYSSAVG